MPKQKKATYALLIAERERYIGGNYSTNVHLRTYQNSDEELLWLPERSVGRLEQQAQEHTANHDFGTGHVRHLELLGNL